MLIQKLKEMNEVLQQQGKAAKAAEVPAPPNAVCLLVSLCVVVQLKI